MKKITEVSDRIIDLSHGDRVAITIRRKEIVFDFFIDGTGNGFSLTKKELKEMIERNNGR